jgi:hypothetical protein
MAETVHPESVLFSGATFNRAGELPIETTLFTWYLPEVINEDAHESIVLPSIESGDEDTFNKIGLVATAIWGALLETHSAFTTPIKVGAGYQRVRATWLRLNKYNMPSPEAIQYIIDRYGIGDFSE